MGLAYCRQISTFARDSGSSPVRDAPNDEAGEMRRLLRAYCDKCSPFPLSLQHPSPFFRLFADVGSPTAQAVSVPSLGEVRSAGAPRRRRERGERGPSLLACRSRRGRSLLEAGWSRATGDRAWANGSTEKEPIGVTKR